MVASTSSALISCLSAACVASLCTLAVEKLGGTLGGIIASSPTTVVVFSVGQALGGASTESLQRALYAVPCGMATNAVFLLLWRELPASAAFQSLHFLSTAYAKLAFMIVCSLCVWAAGASGMLLLLSQLHAWQWNFRVPGVVLFVALVAFGVAISVWKHVPAPPGTHKPHWFVYVLRGILAGVAVGSAILVSRISDFVAGLASTFPAIFLTSMVSLWLSQGAAVQSGSVGPMILGSTAVSGFAFAFAELLPALQSHMSLTAAAFVCAACAYIITLLTCTLPSIRFLRAVNDWHASQMQPSDSKPTDNTTVQAAPLSRTHVLDESTTATTMPQPLQPSAVSLWPELEGVDLEYYPDRT
jgi:hypothetical protein